ncbi:MAG: lysophospholipid acyltransferase family protein [Candidatus Gastranaerophilales bacterium]|nr:lysophospholipid acyltransferase family protein [Candidatus Gastranaerophilales bacterium]
MRTEEALYNQISPSFRRKLVPFIAADASDFWRNVADMVFSWMLRHKFAALRLKGLHNIHKRDKSKPCIIYAPHICWWDAIIAYYTCRKILKFDTRFMAEELHLAPYLKKLGIFSIDKKSPKTILKSLDFAIKNLDAPNKAVFIYPQGIIGPQDGDDFVFNSGISYLASRIEGVNLIPIAVRYGFLRESSPEVMIEINPPIVLESVKDRHEVDYLCDHFKELLDRQRREISMGDVSKYITVIKKRENIFRYFEKKIKT